MKLFKIFIAFLLGTIVLAGCSPKIGVNNRIALDKSSIDSKELKNKNDNKCVTIDPKKSNDVGYKAMMDPNTELGKQWKKIQETDKQIYDNSVLRVEQAKTNLEAVQNEMREKENELQILEEKLNKIPNDESHKMSRMFLQNGDIFNVKQSIKMDEDTIKNLTTVIKSGEEANKAYEEYMACIKGK